MAETMTACATLETGMRFEARSGSGHQVTLDAAEHGGGQDTGFRPMELLLVGLAGCTGMDVISILRKKRQLVSAYEVQVTGVRAEDHPLVFVEITVHHIITGHHIQPEAVRRAIQLSESRYCGAGAMLGRVAHLTHTYHLVEDAETLAIAAPLD
ncbi:MAG TPA: OsmC family protein [Ktedonobacteraceae bacterium]|jgi:putative redox protein|nr:OsmC family protein [Ktedonobacteraceae bacterium]